MDPLPRGSSGASLSPSTRLRCSSTARRRRTRSSARSGARSGATGPDGIPRRARAGSALAAGVLRGRMVVERMGVPAAGDSVSCECRVARKGAARAARSAPALPIRNTPKLRERRHWSHLAQGSSIAPCRSMSASVSISFALVGRARPASRRPAQLTLKRPCMPSSAWPGTEQKNTYSPSLRSTTALVLPFAITSVPPTSSAPAS